jgi:hypothetical protein
MARQRTGLAAVALLVAVGAVVATDRAFPAEAPRIPAAGVAETLPLSAATLVCPDVAEAGKGPRSTRVTYVSELAGGTVTAHWLTPGVADATSPGSDQPQTLAEQTGNFGGVVLTASGAAAAGFSAQLTSRYDDGPTAGTAGLACAAPTSSAYFAGPATTVGHDPRLVLVNPDPTPANVDVSVAQDTKPFSPDSTRGIALPGYGSTTIALVDVAPEQGAVAVHVQTRSGRVTAAIRDRWFTGSVPRGVDWLTPGAPPGTDLVLPGVGGPATTVSLTLVSQSADAGTVAVQALNDTGSFTPAGLDAIALAPGAIVRLSVPKSAFAGPGALHVTSDVPLLASAVSTRADTAKQPRPDFAWTPSATALSGPTRTPSGSQLVLTSASDTTVEVQSPSQASATPTTLDVPAGTAVTFPLAGYPDGVIVVPRDPGVLSAAVVATPAGLGGALTSTALSTQPRTVVLLPARPDIFLGSR